MVARRLQLFLLSASVILWWASAAMAAAADPDPAPEVTGSEASAAAETPAQTRVDPRDALRQTPAPPAGVRFGRPLENGDRFRLSYSFERVKRQGLMARDRDTTPGNVRNDFPIAYTSTPRSLYVTRHDFQLAYAPHPRVTLVFELPYLQKELETLEASGSRFQDETDGVGDLGFGVIVPFIKKGGEESHVHILFDAPTGAIRRGGDNTRLPYDNQIGNGTWDFEWGWTYRGAWKSFAWGGQAVGRHPLGRNGLHYREGSRFQAGAWGIVKIFRGVSASLRLRWEKQNNFRGRDRGLDPIDDPSKNGKARGGTRFDISPGIELVLPKLKYQRLSFEVDLPVFQNLDGPQLERDWAMKAAWQWDF